MTSAATFSAIVILATMVTTSQSTSGKNFFFISKKVYPLEETLRHFFCHSNNHVSLQLLLFWDGWNGDRQKKMLRFWFGKKGRPLFSLTTLAKSH